MNQLREGRLAIDSDGHEIYYKLIGKADQTLVVLHGGPGADHRYLERLGEVAAPGLQVLLYDQLGSGESDRPDDPALYVVPRFVDELHAVREELQLGKMHLFGQSWGGFLALQYALDQPGRVQSLVLSNTAASATQSLRGMARMRLELEPKAVADLLVSEMRGDTESEAYGAALKQLYIRHLRRSTPFEVECAEQEFDTVAAPLFQDLGPAYEIMWGPNEFACTGNLLDWDVTERLGEITVPALILTGWYDSFDLDCHRTLAAGLADNEFVIFGNSSHGIVLEKEACAYLAVISDFVRRKGQS